MNHLRLLSWLYCSSSPLVCRLQSFCRCLKHPIRCCPHFLLRDPPAFSSSGTSGTAGTSGESGEAGDAGEGSWLGDGEHPHFGQLRGFTGSRSPNIGRAERGRVNLIHLAIHGPSKKGKENQSHEFQHLLNSSSTRIFTSEFEVGNQGHWVRKPSRHCNGSDSYEMKFFILTLQFLQVVNH